MKAGDFGVMFDWKLEISEVRFGNEVHTSEVGRFEFLC